MPAPDLKAGMAPCSCAAKPGMLAMVLWLCWTLERRFWTVADSCTLGLAPPALLIRSARADWRPGNLG